MTSLQHVAGRLAQVVKIKGSHNITGFSGTEGIATNAEVSFFGDPPSLMVSEELSGRFFNAYGEPSTTALLLRRKEIYRWSFSKSIQKKTPSD
jgi:vacuolar-type H+-ATPase subunit B/Vma2